MIGWCSAPSHSCGRKKRSTSRGARGLGEIRAAAGAAGAGPKLLGLEIIRFACALVVLIWHYHHFAMIGDAAAMQGPHRPLEWLLWPFYDFGLFGVQLFWCISGFIFHWKYADALAERRVEPGRFFWLRFSRLYPLHLVTLLAVAALQPAYVALAGQPFVFGGNDSVGFALHLLLADQWGGPRDMSFNGPIWSVSAEVMVYAGFFLLVRAFGASPWLIVAAIAASLASLWSTAISPAIICGGYFFAGGAAARVLRTQGEAPARLVAAAMLVFGAAAAPFLNLGNPATPALATWLMFMGPPLLLLAAQDWRGLDRHEARIAAAGNLTYSTYLIHFPLQLGIAILALASGTALPVAEPWFLLAYLAVTLALGRLTFLHFEAPAQSWIRALAFRSSARTAAA